MSERITIDQTPYLGAHGEPWVVILPSDEHTTEVVQFETKAEAVAWVGELDDKIGLGDAPRPFSSAHITAISQPFDVDELLQGMIEDAERRAGWDPSP